MSLTWGPPTPANITGGTNTDTKISSFWRNFRHWLHWKLPTTSSAASDEYFAKMTVPSSSVAVEASYIAPTQIYLVKIRVTGLCDWQWPVDSPHKGPVTRKMFSFDCVFMATIILTAALKRKCHAFVMPFSSLVALGVVKTTSAAGSVENVIIFHFSVYFQW